MKTLRLFEILERLRTAGRPLSAEALAQELEVSLRTIYRDMATLQAMGAPVRGESGLGFQLEAGYFLPPLHFDAEELDAIMLGMRLLRARGDQEMAEASKRVSAKIEATMPPEWQVRYRQLPWHAVSVKAEASSKAEPQLPLLRQAVRQRKVLDLVYTDLEGKRSHRLVHPLGLTQFDRAWVLTAWCLSRQDFRNFRVDLITKAEPTGEVFTHQAGQRFSDYLKLL